MMDASEALAWGLIDEVVRPEELRQRVQAYAEDLASKPAAALAAIRRTVTTRRRHDIRGRDGAGNGNRYGARRHG